MTKIRSRFLLIPMFVGVAVIISLFEDVGRGEFHGCLQHYAYAGTDEADRNGFIQPHHGVIGRLDEGIARVRPLLTRYGYAALFVAILVEGFGIPAPGQTLLMAASFDASTGRLSIVWVLAFAATAAVAGNAIGYLVGRLGGRPLLRRIRIDESRLDRIEQRFARSGTAILLVARFFDGLRQLNGIMAGLLEMSLGEFALWNTLGGILWVGIWGLGPYFLGKKIAVVHLTFSRIEPFILGLTFAAVIALAGYLLMKRRSRKG